jgi:hypothetical protein
VWPELLEHFLQSKSTNTQYKAEQSVRVNRQVLLATLGPELEAALPRGDRGPADYPDGYSEAYADCFGSDYPDGYSKAFEECFGNRYAGGYSNGYPGDCSNGYPGGNINGCAGGNSNDRPGGDSNGYPGGNSNEACLCAELPRTMALQQEDTRTAATALRDRLPKVVQLLARSDAVAQPVQQPLHPYGPV